MVTLKHGDCRELLKDLPDNSVDAVVTDPPYELTANKKGGSGELSVNLNSPAGRSRITTGFMNKRWDGTGVAFDVALWAEVLRVLKPGGHLLAFGGTRTYHRMACAIEDAGFEIRDSLHWMYGSGFPKSMDLAKAIDKQQGVAREDKFENSFDHGACGPTGNKRCDVCNKWLVSSNPCTCPRPQDAPVTDAAKAWQGWGTAIKPAHEPIVLARKPIERATTTENVLQYGTGGLNIDGCRITCEGGSPSAKRRESARTSGKAPMQDRTLGADTAAEAEAMGRMGRRGDPNVYMAERSGERLGRWPANVILSHHDDCRLVGIRDVKTGVAVQRNGGGMSWGTTVYSGVKPCPPKADVSYGEDGVETVERWECVPGCPVAELDRQSGTRPSGASVSGTEPSSPAKNVYGQFDRVPFESYDDLGGASRFFYVAKASRRERDAGCDDLPLLTTRETVGREPDSAGANNPRAGAGRSGGVRNNHPTVKPLELMRYLVRLVTPTGGLVLDPFLGSGTTGCAAVLEGFSFIGFELTPEYIPIAEARIKYWASQREETLW